MCASCGLPIAPGQVHVTYRGGLPAVIEHTACASAEGYYLGSKSHTNGAARTGAPTVPAAKPQRDWLAPTGRLP
jgi:hypothetical protein